MGLPITTTIAGEWLNSLIFHQFPRRYHIILQLMDRRLYSYVGTNYVTCLSYMLITYCLRYIAMYNQAFIIAI